MPEAELDQDFIQAQPEGEPDPIFPLAEAGQYYVGLWNNYPNYGCPYCLFRTLAGDGAVELHILEKIDQGSAKHAKALELKGEQA